MRVAESDVWVDARGEGGYMGRGWCVSCLGE